MDRYHGAGNFEKRMDAPENPGRSRPIVIQKPHIGSPVTGAPEDPHPDTSQERLLIRELVEALLPFARYAKHMEKAWTQSDGNAFYGVKRRDAPQIRIGDLRRAQRLLDEGKLK